MTQMQHISVFFYFKSETENTSFKTCDKGRGIVEGQNEHDKQNLQKSLMGPSGWQKKKQFKR